MKENAKGYTAPANHPPPELRINNPLYGNYTEPVYQETKAYTCPRCEKQLWSSEAWYCEQCQKGFTDTNGPQEITTLKEIGQKKVKGTNAKIVKKYQEKKKINHG